MPAIVVGDRKLVYSVGLALSLAALAVGAWVLHHLGFFPPAALALVLFAFGAAVFAWLLATGPYVLRVDARGIHDRTGALAAGRVDWDELESVRPVLAAGRPQIGFVLRPEARERRGLVARGAMEALRHDVGVDFVIPPEALGPGPADAIDRARRFESWLGEPAARKELEG